MLSRPYWLSTSYNLNCLVMLSCLFQIKMPFQNSSVCYEHVVQPLISQFWRAEGSKPDSQSTTTVQNLPPKPHLGQAFVGILHAQRPTHVGEMFRPSAFCCMLVALSPFALGGAIAKRRLRRTQTIATDNCIITMKTSKCETCNPLFCRLLIPHILPMFLFFLFCLLNITLSFVCSTSHCTYCSHCRWTTTLLVCITHSLSTLHIVRLQSFSHELHF